MQKSAYYLLLCLCFILSCESSSKQIPTTAPPPKVEGFESFTINEIFEGDLNNDKRADKIIVYEKECDSLSETGIAGALCRTVAIFLQTESKEYQLFATNNQLIECSECGGAGVGDPFQNITIKGPYFSIECLYGACDKTFAVTTFKYDSLKKDFFLYKLGEDNYNCNNPDKATTTVKTEKNFGIVRFKDY